MKLSELTDKCQEVGHEGHAEKDIIFSVQGFYKPKSYELIDPSDVEVTTENGKVKIIIKRYL